MCAVQDVKLEIANVKYKQLKLLYINILQYQNSICIEYFVQ